MFHHGRKFLSKHVPVCQFSHAAFSLDTHAYNVFFYGLPLHRAHSAELMVRKIAKPAESVSENSDAIVCKHVSFKLYDRITTPGLVTFCYKTEFSYETDEISFAVRRMQYSVLEGSMYISRVHVRNEKFPSFICETSS